jgi:uncharacterized protein (TIGR02246 family)
LYVRAIAGVVERYLRAADDHDWDALVSCFTPDATVVDEGNTYRGRPAIRAWREAAAAKYTFTSTVLEEKKVADDGYEVISLLRGDFPGGEATLKSTFLLKQDLIHELTMT